jgi:hypothetical protein
MFWPIIFTIALAVALLFAWLMGFEDNNLPGACAGQQSQQQPVKLRKLAVNPPAALSDEARGSTTDTAAEMPAGSRDRAFIFTGGRPFARTHNHQTPESGKLRTSLARLNPELLAVNSIVRRIV